IQGLQQRNKELENALKIERMSRESTVVSGTSGSSSKGSDRRESVSILHHRMFRRFLESEEQSEEAITTLKARIEELERQLRVEQVKTEEVDRGRRESISTLHSNMFKQLLDAEADHDQKIKDLLQQIKDLKQQVKFLELENSTLKQQMASLCVCSLFFLALSSCLFFLLNSKNKGTETKAKLNQYANISNIFTPVAEHGDNNQSKKDMRQAQKEFRPSNIQNMQDTIDYYKQAYEGERMKVQQLQSELEEKESLLVKWSQNDAEDVGELRQKIIELENQLLTTRQFADETERNRRASINYLSNQMMSSLVDAEHEHEQSIKELRETIKNLEKEKQNLNSQMHAEEKKRKSSNAEVSATMFNKLLLVEQEKDGEKQKYEEQIQKYEEQIQKLQQQLQQLQKNKTMETPQLNSQQEHQKQVNQLLDQLNQLKTVADIHRQCQPHITALNERIAHLETSKLVMIEECNRQMNLLRTGLRVMNKK
ncbi:viral A-type inclusion protein, partial [Reticulomyxa filosa]